MTTQRKLRLTIAERSGVTVLEAVTPEQLVGLLWKRAFIRSTTPWTYMQDVSGSAMIQVGKRVRYDTAWHFLADLDAAKLITMDWGDDPR